MNKKNSPSELTRGPLEGYSHYRAFARDPEARRNAQEEVTPRQDCGASTPCDFALGGMSSGGCTEEAMAEAAARRSFGEGRTAPGPHPRELRACL